VIAALIFFVLVLLLTGGGIALLMRAQARERHEQMQLRLRMLGSDEAAAQALEGFRPLSPQLANPLVRAVSHLLWRTGVEVEAATVQNALLLSLLIVPVSMVLFGLVGGLLMLAVVCALIWGVLARRAARRHAKLLEQLPLYLESVMRVLSAGNTLEEALAASARESPEPLRPLMLSLGRQVRLGAPVEQVLMELGDIHRLRDFKVMALASGINRRYGGSLRDIFKSLVQAIRQREVASRELRALTAETRFSALVLSVVPVTISLYIYIQNPDYYSAMWVDLAGRVTLMASITLQVLGVFVIMNMMRSTEEPL
jgi:tight adherence protein B